jgi:hypothetical protein
MKYQIGGFGICNPHGKEASENPAVGSKLGVAPGAPLSGTLCGLSPLAVPRGVRRSLPSAPACKWLRSNVRDSIKFGHEDACNRLAVVRVANNIRWDRLNYSGFFSGRAAHLPTPPLLPTSSQSEPVREESILRTRAGATASRPEGEPRRNCPRRTNLTASGNSSCQGSFYAKVDVKP